MSRTSLKVELLSYTPHPDEVVATGARMCYSSAGVEDLIRGVAEKDQSKYLQRIVDMGHLSPIEHASFTFAVEAYRGRFWRRLPGTASPAFPCRASAMFPRQPNGQLSVYPAALYRGVGAGSRSRVRPADGDHAEMV